MSSIVRPRQPNEALTIPNGEPIIFAEGRIGAIVQFPVLTDEGDGYVTKVFEKFCRPPGTRIIALKDKKIYLQQEARLERNNQPDWRLPGGKVFDTFKEFKAFLTKPIPESTVLNAAAKELHEEAHLEAKKLNIFTKQECGATVEWDLFYVIATDLTDKSHTDHREAEDIRDANWFTFDEVLEKCKQGEIGEGRSVAVLLKFIYEQK